VVITLAYSFSVPLPRGYVTKACWRSQVRGEEIMNLPSGTRAGVNVYPLGDEGQAVALRYVPRRSINSVSLDVGWTEGT
jgi:hypothetical protein